MGYDNIIVGGDKTRVGGMHDLDADSERCRMVEVVMAAHSD